MLTVHHLGRSQSERIVWLCEELGLPYTLVRYERDPVTILAPPELKGVHPLGSAPVIEADGIVLAESGAIVEYLLATHGGGRLTMAPGAPGFADYLHWFHFANGTLQPTLSRCFSLRRLNLPADNPSLAAAEGRVARAFLYIDARLTNVPYLAGEALSAADIMTVFSLTTMRSFVPVPLAPYPGIRAYLQRIGSRDAYRRAIAKGDPGFAPVLG